MLDEVTFNDTLNPTAIAINPHPIKEDIPEL